MQLQSQVKVVPTISDKVIEVASWLLLIAYWCYIAYHYPALPGTIPIHYNAAGIADAYGSKAHILALPIISTVLFFGLILLGKFISKLPYDGTQITPAKAQRVFTLLQQLFRVMKLNITVVFSLLAFKTIHNVGNANQNLGAWFTPITIALICVPMVYFTFKMFKAGLSNTEST